MKNGFYDTVERSKVRAEAKLRGLAEGVEVRKLNVEDGDLIIFPVGMDRRCFVELVEAMNTVFKGKKFLAVRMNDGQAVKVVHLGGGKR